MNILLDTHILLAVMKRQLDVTYPEIAEVLVRTEGVVLVSVVSLWEIAIKSRLGKLETGMAMEAIVPFCEKSGLKILQISADHAIADIDPEPVTRDPFDRLLLAQCKVEGLKLATVDRALQGHPLALRV